MLRFYFFILIMEMIPATVDVEFNFFYACKIHKFLVSWQKIIEILPLTCDHFEVPFNKHESVILKNENAFILWNDLIIAPQLENATASYMEKYEKYKKDYLYPEYVKISIKTIKPNDNKSDIKNLDIPDILYIGTQKLIDNGELESDENKSFHFNPYAKGKVPLHYDVGIAFDYPIASSLKDNPDSTSK